MTSPRRIDRLQEIAGGYDAVLCDLWGVLHNGIRVHDDAVAALRAFRAGGGAVVLLTNAPRPDFSVARQIEGLGAPRDCYDLIVSSGDATREALRTGCWGQRFHFIGAERDLTFFDGLEVERVAMDSADAILCTGLRDDATETPDDYAGELADGIARGLLLLSANPDVVVDRGERRLWCAGGLAQAYERAGGKTVAFGKPHAPIYDYALAALSRLRGHDIAPGRILAIGDGPATDLPGAAGAGCDALFIAGGLGAAQILDARGAIDPARLDAYLAAEGAAPRWAMAHLA